MKHLLFAIFFLILSCGQSFAAGNIVDRGASSTEVTAQERDDIWLSPSNLPGLISGMTDTTLANEDYLLFWDYSDNSTLKKVDAAEIIGGGAGGDGNVTSDANVTDNRLVKGDGGTLGIQETGITVDDDNNVTGIGSLSATSIELSHASDNTLTAASGVLSIEGTALVKASSEVNSAGTIADSVTVTGWVLGASAATTPAGDDADTSLATTAWCETTQNYLKTSEVTNTALDDIGDPDAATSISLDDTETITINSAEDSGTVLTINMTDADAGGNIFGLDLIHAGTANSMYQFMRCYGNTNDLLMSISSNGNIDTEGTITASSWMLCDYGDIKDRKFHDTADSGPEFNFGRQRDGDPTANVSDEDHLGEINFKGYYTDEYSLGAVIRAIVDTTPGEDDMGSRLEFLTSPDGSDTPVLALNIDSDGNANFQDGTITTTGAVAGATFNSGQGAYELYAMNQDVESTDAVTFATVDTGQGANELYAMNQDVESTDNVTFNKVTSTEGFVTGPTTLPRISAQDSDCEGTDKDVGRIWWNAITTTDGSEDADFGIDITQGGSEETTVLTFDESDDRWETSKGLVATGTVQGGTLTDGTMSSTSGAVTGIASATFADADASPNAAGEVQYDNSVADQDDGSLAWYDDDEIKYIVSIPAASMPGDAQDDYLIAYDMDTDKYYFKVDATAGSPAWSTIGDAEADKAFSFDDNEITSFSFADTDEDMFTVTGTGAFGDVSVMKVQQATGDASDGTVLEVVAADANVDPLVVSSSGQASALVVAQNTGIVNMAAGADVNNADITSVDKLEGADASEYIDLGADLVEIVSNTIISATAPNVKIAVDAEAYLNIATADAGITTISQVSDGTDEIKIGDAGDLVSVDSGNWDVSNAGVFSGMTGITSTGAIDFGGATTVEIPNADDPDASTQGEIALDTDGWVRICDDVAEKGIPLDENIHVTVVSPNDLADATRDKFPVWSNETGMSLIITKIEAWADTNATAFVIDEYDADGSSNTAEIDGDLNCVTGSGPYTDTETDISNATVEADHTIFIDFDDTDEPGWVKTTITGYYNGDVD